jgi:hypothetical protein
MRSLHHGPNSFRQGPHLPAQELPPGQVQALDRRRTLDDQQRAYRGMHVKPGGGDAGRRPPG